MKAGDAHQSWLAHVMDKVGSILGGDVTLRVKKDKDGNVTVEHDPSTSGEKWGRVAAAALGGAAHGIAVGQGPGGPARAAAAGIQTGLQQPQQRLDEANQEATVEQQRLQAHANLVLTQQHSVAQTFQNKMNNVAATQAQIDQANAEEERFKNAPGAEEMGTFGSMADVAKSPNVALIMQHHPGGTMRTVPTYDGDHNVTGVKAYVVDKGWADQRNEKPVTYLRAKASDTAGGAPTFETVTIPAGAHTNGEIDTLLNAQNTANLKTNADVAKAKETADKDKSEAELRAQQIQTGKATATKDYAEAAAATARANVMKGVTGGAPGAAGLKGEDYLKASGIDESAWNQIRSTANGDLKMPTASRSPQNQAFRSAVMNYDPTFTDARYDTKQNFKTKGDATSIVQLSTAMSHAERALLNSRRLGDSPSLAVGRNLSGPAADYNSDREFFTGEAGKLAMGGVIGEKEGERIRSQISSPIQSIRDSALHELLHLTGGKVGALFQKYKTGAGQELPVEQFFDQPTQQLLRRYGAAPQQPGQPQQPQQQQPQGAAKAIPSGKVPAFKDGNVVGYADDKKGTNYHAF
jgi:hypothetical protein